MTTADGELVSTTKIVDNGPASLLWNLVILGDGYQTAQMNQYENDVQRVVDAMFRTPPFDEHELGPERERRHVPSALGCHASRTSLQPPHS